MGGRVVVAGLSGRTFFFHTFNTTTHKLPMLQITVAFALGTTCMDVKDAYQSNDCCDSDTAQKIVHNLEGICDSCTVGEPVDFILQGMGTSGATLASLLAQHPSKPTILSLEAGGPSHPVQTTGSLFVHSSSSNARWEGNRYVYTYEYLKSSCSDLNKTLLDANAAAYPKGSDGSCWKYDAGYSYLKYVGGTDGHNGGVLTKGSVYDYIEWPDGERIPGWTPEVVRTGMTNWERMSNYYCKTQSNRRCAKDADKGRMMLKQGDSTTPKSLTFQSAMNEIFNVPYKFDYHSTDTMYGVSTQEVAHTYFGWGQNMSSPDMGGFIQGLGGVYDGDLKARAFANGDPIDGTPLPAFPYISSASTTAYTDMVEPHLPEWPHVQLKPYHYIERIVLNENNTAIGVIAGVLSTSNEVGENVANPNKKKQVEHRIFFPIKQGGEVLVAEDLSKRPSFLCVPGLADSKTFSTCMTTINYQRSRVSKALSTTMWVKASVIKRM